MRMRLGGTSAVAGAAVLAVAGVARADSITFDSATAPFFHFGGTVASFTSTWTYMGISSTEGTLTLTLMNTTSGISPTGAITALAFNTAAGTSLTSTGTGLGFGDNDGPWSSASGTPPPGNIGTFDSVYTVDGADYGGAGDGGTGIEVGDLGVLFTWAVDASTNSDGFTLSVFDFLLPNALGFRFAVKLKGIGPNDESDSLVLVPLPRAVWFGAIGLLGVVAFRRRLLI